jgi:hypothetical protein
MEKDGFAACSMLMLGCVWRCGAALVGACTGGGTRGPCEGGCSASSSSRFTESMRPRSDGADASGARRELRDAGGSFCGGAGGAASDPVGGGVGAPSGPRGSSTASSLVDWVPYWRRRGPRAAGERGAAAAVGVDAAFAAVEDEAASLALVLWEPSCARVAAF